MDIDAGLQLQKLVGIARIERKIGYRAIVDNCAELGAGGIDQGGFRGHVNDFLSSAQLHGHVQGDDLVDVERDAFADILLKSR